MTGVPEQQSLVRRLMYGVGANAFGQIITIISQIVSVPVFLGFWGINLYGEWLVLSAIPSYLSLSDIGFGSVAGNEMIMLVARGERKKALSVFQSSWVLISVISMIIILCSVLVMKLFPLGPVFHIKIMSAYDIQFVLFFLMLQILVSLQIVLMAAAYRAEKKYAKGIFILNTIRFSAFFALTLAVINGAQPPYAALIFFSVMAIGAVGMYLNLRRSYSWVSFGFGAAKLSIVKEFVKPAFWFMAFPAGQIITLQGMVIAINIVLGPVAAVIFSTIRTVTRLAFQTMNILVNSISPEISMAFGNGNIPLVRYLHRRIFQASFWGVAFMVSVLSFSGQYLIQFWTRGRVSADHSFILLMLLAILVNALWYVSSSVQLSINKHQGVALRYLFTSVSSICAAIVLMKFMGLHGVAFAILSADIVMTVFVMKESLLLTQDTLYEFAKCVNKPPIAIIVSKVKQTGLLVLFSLKKNVNPGAKLAPVQESKL
ncbi:MAG TPA: hypothetical protein DF296_00345 [Candidatus Margulisbacteria bacterium]|nr:MAG: hypothetical protein A2X41_01180 [Candidatus Margulisbacteria bacterium GWE2_39_32]HCT83632.1 hypothetical protein [Candidatus Margulisiibacteriota bacterium]